jgi:membrane protein DedA with SNARE-associated domain
MEFTASVETLFLEFITQVYSVIGWPGVVFLMAIETVAVPLPSELVMLLAGWLLIQDKGGSVWLVPLAGFYGALGSLLGSLVLYWASLHGGRRILLRYGKYVLISKDELDKAETWFDKYGERAVLIGRLLPVVRSFISIPAGLARMNLWRFSLYTFAGSFIWSLGLAYAGFMLGENWEDIRAVMRPFDIPILLILAAAGGWFLTRRIKSVRAQDKLYDAANQTPPDSSDE